MGNKKPLHRPQSVKWLFILLWKQNAFRSHLAHEVFEGELAAGLVPAATAINRVEKALGITPEGIKFSLAEYYCCQRGLRFLIERLGRLWRCKQAVQAGKWIVVHKKAPEWNRE